MRFLSRLLDEMQQRMENAKYDEEREVYKRIIKLLEEYI